MSAEHRAVAAGVDPAAPDLGLRLDRAARAPLYTQIAQSIRDGITRGLLPVGARLPPERQLAARLGIDRTTVVAAYRELAADGLIDARVGRGTMVAATTRDRADLPAAAPGIAWGELFAHSVRDDDPVLDQLAELAGRADFISFAAGIPAPEHYPTAEIRALLDEALGTAGEGLLQYCPPEGLAPLREVIAARLTARGALIDPDRVLVCAGSQQGLYLLARSLIEPGDVVAVESPTYHGALQVFRAVGARIVPLPADREGIDPDRIGDLLARRTIKLLYVLPTFQNPTGATLSRDRRERLLRVARRYGVVIVEDDPYGELRYGGAELPSLLGIDRAARDGVIYLSTFSKTLFPGFRLGWVVAPPPVIERLAWVKSLVDLDSNPLAQWAVAEYVDRGGFDAHLDRVRQVYPVRRDALASSLADRAGDLLDWRLPEGGFYLWARLASGLRAREVLAESISRGAAFVPGDLFHADGGGRHTMRLAFSALTPSQIAAGAARLGDATRAAMERHATRVRTSPPSTRIV